VRAGVWPFSIIQKSDVVCNLVRRLARLTSPALHNTGIEAIQRRTINPKCTIATTVGAEKPYRISPCWFLIKLVNLGLQRPTDETPARCRRVFSVKPGPLTISPALIAVPEDPAIVNGAPAGCTWGRPASLSGGPPNRENQCCGLSPAVRARASCLTAAKYAIPGTAPRM
jgi:hypothetical protein